MLIILRPYVTQIYKRTHMYLFYEIHDFSCSMNAKLKYCLWKSLKFFSQKNWSKKNIPSSKVNFFHCIGPFENIKELANAKCVTYRKISYKIQSVHHAGFRSFGPQGPIDDLPTHDNKLYLDCNAVYGHDIFDHFQLCTSYGNQISLKILYCRHYIPVTKSYAGFKNNHLSHYQSIMHLHQWLMHHIILNHVQQHQWKQHQFRT